MHSVITTRPSYLPKARQTSLPRQIQSNISSLPKVFRTTWQLARKLLNSVCSNKQSMLILGTPFSVRGSRRPIIRPGDILRRPFGNHRFNGKCDALLHNSKGISILVVQHVRGSVKDRRNTMAAEITNDRETSGVRVRLNNSANLVDGDARGADIDCPLEAVERIFDECATRRVHIADEEHFGAVAVKAVVEEGDIDVNNVAADEDGAVRNAVANNLVDGRTATLGEAVVVERARVGVAVNAGGVDDHVNLVCGDARLDEFAGDVEDFAGEAACDAHFGNLFRRVDDDIPGEFRRLPARLPFRRVVGGVDGVRDEAGWRLHAGAKLAGVFEL